MPVVVVDQRNVNMDAGMFLVGKLDRGGEESGLNPLMCRVPSSVAIHRKKERLPIAALTPGRPFRVQ
jgi:hypothetical protein